MLQQTLMFLASETPPAQAAILSPPANPLPSGRRLRLVLNVAASAVGFASLLGGLWYSLWLMQALVQTPGF